jgi:hypothetical protein
MAERGLDTANARLLKTMTKRAGAAYATRSKAQLTVTPALPSSCCGKRGEGDPFVTYWSAFLRRKEHYEAIGVRHSKDTDNVSGDTMGDIERDALIQRANHQLSVLRSLIQAAREAVDRTRALIKRLSGNHQIPQA